MGEAYVRREQRPANEQRPPGNPEEQKEGPRAVSEFDGEFVQTRDEVTMSEDVNTPRVAKAANEADNEQSTDTAEDTEGLDEVFVCPDCEREFKTSRGLDNHYESKHGDEA